MFNSLKKLKRFDDAILTYASHNFLNLILNNKIANEDRIDIYKSDIRKKLKISLKLTFPGIWKILGDNLANQIATDFIYYSNNMSTISCLEVWGETFSSFISSIKDLNDIEYLADFARYEWYRHKSYCSELIDFDNVIGLEFQNTARLSFHFNPSVFLYKSYYPIKAIDNIVNGNMDQGINIFCMEECALIYCYKGKVISYWISEEEYSLLMFLKKGGILDDYGSYTGNNICELLVFLVTNNVININKYSK